MCGINGIAKPIEAGEPLDPAMLMRMRDVLRHRGPDDCGVYTDGRMVALGHRRLSIIDVAAGHQPMTNEDGSLHIVFNGEIYNHAEHRAGLEARGHVYATHCDTETILHLYEEYGAGCVEYLRGMFAFAIWDTRKRELFIARDRTGKKPLYYTTTSDGTFLFGSELKSLLVHPQVERAINFAALDSYLTLGYVPDPLTIFDRVHKLPPGFHLTLRATGDIKIEEYWDFDYRARGDEDGGNISESNWARGGASAPDLLDELRRLLAEAVRVRLVSEVPLGAFLSGGVDSSTVVALMSRHARETGAARVKTFSIGFHEDSYNELAFARQAAEAYNTDHHEFVVTPDICRIVEDLVHHFDEPFADSSAIPTYMVSKLAREHVTVALSGDGGDELFAGYTRYAVEARRRAFTRLPRLVRNGVLRPLSRNLPHGARGRNYLHNIALDPTARYLDSVSIFTELDRASLYTGDFRARLDDTNTVARMFHELAARVTTGEALDTLLYLDSKTYLPGDILTKVDRMSMAVSLETRAPLLDQELINFVTRLPARFKMRGLETKTLLKEAVRPWVPDAIINRRKQGFGVPVDEWINRELRDQIRDTLTSQRARGRGYFNPAHVELLFAEHECRRRDHSSQLWSLYMLELWHCAYMDCQSVAEGDAFSPASMFAPERTPELVMGAE